MDRLPRLPRSTDSGYVYVARRGDVYKIGFSRHNVARQCRDRGATLVLTIPCLQRPSQLEYAINHRFSHKRLPPQGTMPGDKREWFALDADDLTWLHGLAAHVAQA